jgi:hypothetical protein
MSTRQLQEVATHTARSIRRRLAVAARERSRGGHVRRGPEPVPGAAEERADDARLDSLRGELVRALDRLAADDEACSAAFRRI